MPELELEHPISFDADQGGELLVLDRGGRRLSLWKGSANAQLVKDAPAARRCRFFGEHLMLLCGDGQLRTMLRDGSPVGELKLREGAANIAVDKGGSVVIGYGRAGETAHRVLLERLGASPVTYDDDLLCDAATLATESGGIWVGGTGTGAPAMLQLRPSREGLTPRTRFDLPAPPRAAAEGPDGAIYILLEPGETLLRAFGSEITNEFALTHPLHELVRAGGRLLGCGSHGFLDLTGYIPGVPESPVPPDLPSCGG